VRSGIKYKDGGENAAQNPDRRLAAVVAAELFMEIAAAADAHMRTKVAMLNAKLIKISLRYRSLRKIFSPVSQLFFTHNQLFFTLFTSHGDEKRLFSSFVLLTGCPADSVFHTDSASGNLVADMMSG